MIIVSCLVVLIALTILMQPILFISDAAHTQLTTNSTHMKQGKDLNGSIVNVGYASAFPDITFALISIIGLAFILGTIWFIIKWNHRSDYPPQGGVQF